MEIDIFTICDFAQDTSGKLTIVGTFDTIFTSGLPATLSTCSIAARIRLQNNAAGQHTFKLTLLDYSNKEILPPVSGNINVQTAPGNDWVTVNLVIAIGLLKLPSYGDYSVRLLFDDKQIKSLPFSVKDKPKGA